MWESRVRCGISKRGGNGGKVGVGLFHGSHGASFPQPSSGFWAILARMSSLGTLEVQFLIFQNPRQMHIFPDSCGEPFSATARPNIFAATIQHSASLNLLAPK